MKYAVRRLAQFVSAGGSLVLSFLFADLAPGDFFSEMRLERGVTAETVAALRARHGLDRPLPVRYATWLGSMARGEFGYSLAYNSAVGPAAAAADPGHVAADRDRHAGGVAAGGSTGHLERGTSRHLERSGFKCRFRFCCLSQSFIGDYSVL